MINLDAQIERLGEPVTIKYKTEALDPETEEPVKDRGGHPEYTVTEKETKARVYIPSSSELYKDNLRVIRYDAIAYFMKRDQEYLAEDNRVTYDGQDYLMMPPKKRLSHFEVELSLVKTG